MERTERAITPSPTAASRSLPGTSAARVAHSSRARQGPLLVGLAPQGGLREMALGDRMVAHVVKRRYGAAGINPDHVAGHSLRRGFATAAARAKKPDRMI
ncbi:MAG: hypothetical protein M3Z07_01945 [Candidatus Eremiobacteraeota bacterium]|nr:hypothetical protein [Candidatus Eremiobacteraeota bacterium]